MRLVRRHGLLLRLTHWVNVAAVAVLLMSGLQVFNAHPALYWGEKSVFAAPWLSIEALERPGGKVVGVTRVGGLAAETTGILGVSGKASAPQFRAFPAWSTAPGFQSLADGRRWHFTAAWLFVINGAVYLCWGFVSGRFRRELLPARSELTARHLWGQVVDHARLRFHRGEQALRYNVLQKLTYLGVVFLLLPLMVATGLTMSPAFNATAPWMLDLFGGRQSARTLHFLTAGGLVLFVILHLAMVLASGPINNLRSMTTGRYRIHTAKDADEQQR
jgi:thiosulfate reductase cytochrome b subunit